MASGGRVLGVVLLARHGDRQGFYQDPDTYTPTLTTLTPLGNLQEFQLGQTLRQIYLAPGSPSYILGINGTIADQTQIFARADAGGEGGVILNSATSLLQGLYPAQGNYSTTLANETTVRGPLGGYQYVPLLSVDPNNDISLEGWTSCDPFTTATNEFYDSPAFKEKADEVDGFLKDLPQYLDGRPVSLENMWNVFDFINVQYIHNKQFLDALPATYREQARHLANWHEYGVFTSQQLDGIGNIAGRTILPTILDSFARIIDPKDPLKLAYQAVSYKPFLSLFNMTGVTTTHPELAGIVDYAAAVALEVRESLTGGEPVIRFNFKNGTNDPTFKRFPILDESGDVPISHFVDALAPATINTTAQWCSVCSNTDDRGCGALFAASLGGANSQHHRVSDVGAGFLGAGLMAVVALAMFAVLLFLGVLSIGRAPHRKARQNTPSDDHSVVKA